MSSKTEYMLNNGEESVEVTFDKHDGAIESVRFYSPAFDEWLSADIEKIPKDVMEKIENFASNRVSTISELEDEDAEWRSELDREPA